MVQMMEQDAVRQNNPKGRGTAEIVWRWVRAKGWDGGGYVACAQLRACKRPRGDSPVRDPGNSVNRSFGGDALGDVVAEKV